MIGIYKIVNKETGKTYIGQSVNIERRFKEHCCKKDLVIDQAIEKHGKENFEFEIIEECDVSQLNEREQYYIQLYNTYQKGYNCHSGGSVQIGENNNNTFLTDDDVIQIRKEYAAHKRSKDIYKNFSNKVSYSSFMSIWEGKTWTHIMPEVYTEENRLYYSKQATNGELSPMASFTNDEVINMRERYVNETAKQIYDSYKDRCTYQTIQSILCGKSYKELPVYKKKEKKWINK